MVKLTRAQSESVKRIYDRTLNTRRSNILYAANEIDKGAPMERPELQRYVNEYYAAIGQSYLQFRRTVQGGSGCVMVHNCGIWLGIEPDGYTHS